MSIWISSRRPMTLLMQGSRWKDTGGPTLRGQVAEGTSVKKSLPRKIGLLSVESNHLKVWGAESLKEGTLWLHCFLRSRGEHHASGFTGIAGISRLSHWGETFSHFGSISDLRATRPTDPAVDHHLRTMNIVNHIHQLCRSTFCLWPASLLLFHIR